MNTFIDDQTFEGKDFTHEGLPVAKYENCEFINCNLANVDLSDIHFSECTFRGCDLSNTTLTETAFKTIRFKDCKMLGLSFDNCNDFLFAVDFSNCQMNMCCFYQVNLKGTRFLNCKLSESDFAEADLSESTFEGSDLSDAIFDNTNLEKADFRNARGYSLNPEQNNIKKAKFSINGLPGLLAHFDIEIEH
ncbi:MAG: pentapeptide repeat-containing protein [Bacteroidetes bacterium]|nr:MAG: pentapeptide repeat-containing protein [Bacteroidota bacterium]